MLINSTVYVAVRRTKDDGHDWADTSTVSGCRESAIAAARRNGDKIPHWDAANPVVRVCRFILAELEEGEA
jgi:hypothetical protein